MFVILTKYGRFAQNFLPAQIFSGNWDTKIHHYLQVQLSVEAVTECSFITDQMKNKKKQAGAELGQAQLKLGLGFTSTIDSK